MRNFLLICGALLMIGCGNRRSLPVAAPFAPRQIVINDSGEAVPALIRQTESILGHPGCPDDLGGLYSFSGVSPFGALGGDFDMVIDGSQMIQFDESGRIIHVYRRVECSGEFVNDDFDLIKFSLAHEETSDDLVGTVEVFGDYIAEHHYRFDVILIRE